MQKIKKLKNVPALIIPSDTKKDIKIKLALKNPPNLKPKNKRAK